MRVRLTGNNQIQKFKQVARNLKAQIVIDKNVTGIIFIGGLARGFADQASDLDGIIFLSRKNERLVKNIREITANESKKSKIEIDLETHLLREFQRREWSEIEKWDYSHAEIAFDRHGRIAELIKTKSKSPKEFWLRRLVECAEYMKWYCCPTTKNARTIAETWIERGDLASAHFCVNYAVELILKTVFALNREFMPPPKWGVFYFRNLKWLPESHGQLFNAMKTIDLSVNDLERRLHAIREIWSEILVKIRNETGFGPQEIDRYYVERILNQ